MAESDPPENKPEEDIVFVEFSLVKEFEQNLQMAFILLSLDQRGAYDLLQKDHDHIFRDGRHELPETFENYKRQIRHGAFLLAYSHFEAFIADVARSMLTEYPGKLSSDKELKIEAIKEALKSKKDGEVLRTLVNREVKNIFMGKMESVLDHFKKRFDIDVNPVLKETAIQASKIRNVLMHRGGMADENLPFINVKKDSLLTLGDTEAAEYIAELRQVALDIWAKYPH